MTAGMSMALGQFVLHVLQPTQSHGPDAERASSLNPVWTMRMIAWGLTSMMCWNWHPLEQVMQLKHRVKLVLDFSMISRAKFGSHAFMTPSLIVFIFLYTDCKN